MKNSLLRVPERIASELGRAASACVRVLSMVCVLVLLVPNVVRAAEKVNLLVLPFQINAGKTLDKLNEEVPALFAQRLEAQGFSVVPQQQVMRLLRGQNVNTLSLSTARNLALQAGAAYAVYGSFTGTGDSFSIDARLVPASGGTARPYFVQKKSLIELFPAVDELTGRIAADAVGRNAIADIRIRGLKILDPDVVLMRLGVNKGDTVDPAGINQEVKRIWDLGYFSDVSADLEHSGEGLLLVFTVVEKPRIEDVVVNGSDEVSKDDILAAMSSKTGSVLNERLLADDIQKITDLYRKEGFYLAEVTSRVEERAGTASAVLVFDVKEGNKLYIKDVIIEGLNELDEDDVKKELALSERSLFSWFTGTGVLREDYLERDSAAITAYCYNQGYIDAQVAAPEVSYEEDGITITFRMVEGPRYKLGEIGFRGDLVDTDQRLLDVIALDGQKEDDGHFSLSVMQDDIKKLTDLYGDYGYAFAEVDADTVKHDDNTLDVFYVLNKKQKVRVRRVITEGNIRTRDNVILREMRLADGDVFDGSKLRRSNERLTRLRYFTDVDTAVVPTEREDEVDLHVKVKDDRTGAIMGGVGYSTYYKFGVTGNIMERNVFGRGYSLALRGFISGRSTSVDMSFVNPRLYDTELGLGYDIYAVWDEWDDFRKKTYGNTLRFFYPIGEYTTVGWGYRLDQYTLYNIPESAPRSYKEYEGKNISSVLHGRISYDSTDSRERPSRGLIGRLFVEYGGGGLGGNDNFFKPVAELQGFHTLFGNKDHIFHWRGRMGGVFKNTDKPVPVFDRFFIGGMDSIRGYDTEDLSPLDPEYHDEIGGDRMGFMNLEYIWTFEPELGLALVPFFDFGYQVDSDQTDDMFGDLKKSVGLELRWRSPMGDLRFAYGYPLDKNVQGEKLSGRFEFSMGQFF